MCECAGLQQFLPVVLVCWCWQPDVALMENVACLPPTRTSCCVREWTASALATCWSPMRLPSRTLPPPPPWSGQVTSRRAGWSSVCCGRQSLAVVDRWPPGGSGRGLRRAAGRRATLGWGCCLGVALGRLVAGWQRGGSWGCSDLEGTDQEKERCCEF